jgi:hypothetical protein
MQLITPPEYTTIKDLEYGSLFLAGGISNCPDWQSYVIQKLSVIDITLINPRNANYSDSKYAAMAQIKWEFEYLKRADTFLFWFPCETVCPMTLFELGKQLGLNKYITIGVHPQYSRKLDIECQVSLERPDIEIVYDLDHLIEQVINNYDY